MNNLWYVSPIYASYTRFKVNGKNIASVYPNSKGKWSVIWFDPSKRPENPLFFESKETAMLYVQLNQ